METTYNKLDENQELFFRNLRGYLDQPILFFGSIQRNDYFRGHSDIDIDLFSDNVYSLMTKLQTYLDIPKNKVKKVVWKLQNGKMVSGYKVMYRDYSKKIFVEFSIYDEKYKNNILEEHVYKSLYMPTYAVAMLVIIKTLYYKFNILDDDLYNVLKKYIMGPIIGFNYDKYLVLDKDPIVTDQKINDMFGK